MTCTTVMSAEILDLVEEIQHHCLIRGFDLALSDEQAHEMGAIKVAQAALTSRLRMNERIQQCLNEYQAQWSQGDVPPTWTFRSSPEGRGLLYRWPHDLPCKSTAQASPGEHKELRLMGNGSQTVLPPSRHPSESRYTWEPGHSPDDLPLAPAPDWLRARLCVDVPTHKPASTTPQGTPDYERVHSALDYIPNNDADYNTWLTLGMALHSTGEPWARDLWGEWSAQSGKFDEAQQTKKWESFSTDGAVTIGSLFHLAKQAGWSAPRATLIANRNGSTVAFGAQQDDSTENPQAGGATATWAAEDLLAHLTTLEEEAQEDAILDALPALVPLDTIAWMRLKRRLKVCVKSLNLNDLEKARNELRRDAKSQAAAQASGNSQAQIAAALAKGYAGTFAYDLSRQAWMEYDNGLWTQRETERVTQQIIPFMDDHLGGDYTWHDLSGVEHLLRTRLAQTLTLETPGWPPFRNGALRLETMTLHPHSPDRPFTWQLPHAYNPQATCPKTQAWMHETVGDAHDQVQVLRAYAKAVVTRRVDLQRYLETIGPGGTGKGTYTRLLQALAGSENTFATELKHLEANRFELSNLRGKVLMVITDAERYGGPINQLKAITGQDFVRMEQKFKAQRTEIAPVMVVVSANEPVQSADYTSGLVRRRLSMFFRHRPSTPRDLLSWKDGAWHGDLAAEIPGVLNWVLALPDTQMEALLQKTTELVSSLHAPWASALVDTNPLAEWANQKLVKDDTRDAQGNPTSTNVGYAHKREHNKGYERQEDWLYPNYCAWVDDTGGKPLSARRFTGLLKDLFENQLRCEGIHHHQDKYGSRFEGVRLRHAMLDKELELFITRDGPALMKDGMGMVMDKPRTDEECDGCDGFLHSLYKDLPTPCHLPPVPKGVGVPIGELSENPSQASHSSPMRGGGVIAPIPPLTVAGCTAPQFAAVPVVGDWVWLLSVDAVVQNPTPYQVQAIASGPDGRLYAQFAETSTGWLIEQCERADAPPLARGSKTPPGPLNGTHHREADREVFEI